MARWCEVANGSLRLGLEDRRLRGHRSRFDVAVLECIQLRPEERALSLEGTNDERLQLRRSGVLCRVLKSKRGVFGRLGKPSLKIGKAVLQPWIMFWERVHTQCDEVAGKELGQR